jgi:hypothetical protein
MSMNILSGNGMSTSDAIEQLQSNVTFRLTSARDMLVSITGETKMTPMERRREIRDRRLRLFGLNGDEDMGIMNGGGRGTNDGSNGSSMSGQISTSEAQSTNANLESESASVPSMTDVQRGTKSRASNSGFSDPN